MRNRRSVVTGIGVLCSLGIGEDAWNAILEGGGGASQVHTTMCGHPWHTFPVHAMPALDLHEHLDEPAFTYLEQEGLLKDLDLVYLVIASRSALRDAGLRLEADTRTALVAAHENPGVSRLIEELWRTLFSPDRPAGDVPRIADALFRRHSSAFFHVQAFSYLFHIAKLVGIHGHTMYVNNACASGLYALDAAHQLIQLGRADVVLVAAADHAAQTPKYLWFKDQGLYSPSGVVRPFDRNRDGTVLGEAGASLIVEELAHARRRGAHIYGEYVGGAFGQETWRITLPDVASHTYGRTIRSALDQTRTEPGEVDLVVAHGTATSLADRYEAAALTEAFDSVAPLPPVTALKGYVGHTLGCCALLETCLAFLALRDGVIPAARNHQTTDNAIALPIVTKTEHRRVRTLLRTVNAFGGFDAAAVLRAVDGSS